MEELTLLFVDQVPGLFAGQPTAGDDLVLKADITTPLGKIKSLRQSQLGSALVPYVCESGRTGNIPVQRLYLAQVLDKLKDELHVLESALFDGSRGVVIVARIDLSTDAGGVPVYFGTTRNPVNMANLRRLAANVMRCLDEGRDYLPAEVFSKWNSNILPAIFNQARNVISEQTDGTKSS
jgi:hypothetical protein